MPLATDLDALLERFGPCVSRAGGFAVSAAANAPMLSLAWPEVDAVLPDGGLPCGVVELTAPGALGGMTSVALAAVRAAQTRDARSWCAWIDPDATLYAPGVAMAGVDLSRLLVLRPPRSELARIAVKVAAARAFDVIVLDMDATPGACALSKPELSRQPRGHKRKGAWPIDVLVRKLALLAAEGGATIALLTDSDAPRATAWPVALRLECSHRDASTLLLRVGKDRRGRTGPITAVSLCSKPGLDRQEASRVHALREAVKATHNQR